VVKKAVVGRVFKRPNQFSIMLFDAVLKVPQKQMLVLLPARTKIRERSFCVIHTKNQHSPTVHRFQHTKRLVRKVSQFSIGQQIVHVQILGTAYQLLGANLATSNTFSASIAMALSRWLVFFANVVKDSRCESWLNGSSFDIHVTLHVVV
jgi:hypothetical protein